MWRDLPVVVNPAFHQGEPSGDGGLGVRRNPVVQPRPILLGLRRPDNMPGVEDTSQNRHAVRGGNS